MGTFHKAYWASEGAGRSRRERRSGEYEYYVPTPLADLSAVLEADVVGDVARAERAIAELNAGVAALHSSEGIARLLLRAEAVSSSHIEGLTIGTRRLLRAEANLGGGEFRGDAAAAEVVGNIHAMQDALDTALGDGPVTVDTILGIHRTLLADTRIADLGGVVRDRQNWVGGNSYNPLEADYVPPAPESVGDLLEDVAAYCNDELPSPVLQAALVHAQFETIHPFMDGNGRTGRALIHLVLRKRGLAPNLVPPISLVLATHAKSYVDGLAGFRGVDGGGDAAAEGVNEWVSFFAGSCAEACEEAAKFEEAAAHLQDSWRERLGSVRANSALDVLLPELVGMPLFTVKSAAAATGRSVSSMNVAVQRCLDAGIAKAAKKQKRNRAFEVPEVIDEFNLFERRLASPVGDTRAARPVRPVPENLAKKKC